MEHLDEKLHDAKQEYEVSHHLVDTIMEAVKALPPPRRNWFQRLHIRTIVLAATPALVLGFVAITFLSLNSGTVSLHTNDSKSLLSPPPPKSNSTNTSPSSSQTSGSADGSTAAGTDNTSLNNALNDVSSSLSENQTSFNAANSAINNQQLDTPPSD